jgi:cell wall-associated NlpC family hydrolase
MLNSKVFAATATNNNLVTSQNNYNQSVSSEETAQNEVNSINATIEKMDNQIQQSINEIYNINNQIQNKELEILRAKQSLLKSEAEIKIQQDTFNKRIRAMYMNEDGGYLSVILNSSGISDFISRVEILKRISYYNNAVISTLNESKQELGAKENKLIADNKQLAILKNNNERQLAQLNNQKLQEEPLLSQAKAKAEALISISASYKAQVEAAQTEADMLKSADTSTNTIMPTSINRGNYSNDAIISYASTFLGTPYVWGGSSPSSGFDCSGFVQYVYNHFGISVGRTTYDQIKDGVEVSENNLQPGDIIFFGTYSNPYHEGIYVGNGMFIEAPRTGESVKISPLSGRDYLTARRVK